MEPAEGQEQQGQPAGSQQRLRGLEHLHARLQPCLRVSASGQFARVEDQVKPRLGKPVDAAERRLPVGMCGRIDRRPARGRAPQSTGPSPDGPRCRCATGAHAQQDEHQAKQGHRQDVAGPQVISASGESGLVKSNPAPMALSSPAGSCTSASQENGSIPDGPLGMSCAVSMRSPHPAVEGVRTQRQSASAGWPRRARKAGWGGNVEYRGHHASNPCLPTVQPRKRRLLAVLVAAASLPQGAEVLLQWTSGRALLADQIGNGDVKVPIGGDGGRDSLPPSCVLLDGGQLAPSSER